jgi:hypothetical protein
MGATFLVLMASHLWSTNILRGPKTALAGFDQLKQCASPTMKKYICVLAGAALLAACEQKTETVTPATSPTPTTPPPAAADMTSPAATEAPAVTTESPADATESPADATESPTDTEETPAESPAQ